MRILNRQNIITNEQVINIINMLGKQYRPQTLVLYENKLDMFRYYPACFNFSLEEFRGELEGSYDETTDTAYICIFSQIDDGDDLHSKQLYSIHALVHELRHRYQHVNNLFYDEDHLSEKDADNFATNFINKKSHKISKIMDWKEEWTIEEED